MRPRGFYRSWLFWVGLPGLMFLLWGWWNSGKYSSDVVWRRGSADRALVVYTGRVQWRTIVWVPGMRGRVDRFFVHHSEMLEMESFEEGPRGRRGRQFDFPKPLMVEAERGAAGTVAEMRRVEVALWVVMLGYVGAWLGAVWWWQRRQARVMKDLTEAAVEAEVAG